MAKDAVAGTTLGFLAGGIYSSCLSLSFFFTRFSLGFSVFDDTRGLL